MSALFEHFLARSTRALGRDFMTLTPAQARKQPTPADAVKKVMTVLGVADGRIETISYGEEKPKHDNSREETRRLNRRQRAT